MLNILKKVEFDIGDKPWTSDRIGEVVKCLDSVLSKQGDPFTRLLTSPQMAEALYKLTGSKKFATSTGDIFTIVLTAKYTINHPWFVQTFHGFDCSEILFDFSKAFTTPFADEKKEEPVAEKTETSKEETETFNETPKEETETTKKETKDSTKTTGKRAFAKEALQKWNLPQVK